MLRTQAIFCLFLFLIGECKAQHLYYKKTDPAVIAQFNDSTGRLVFMNNDSVLRKQFAYVLRFFPEMLVGRITIDFRPSKRIARTRPAFASIFKMPAQRSYKITFSSLANSTLDSVVISNLSLDSRIGLIANQVSLIEDLSTGGFFNFLAFYFKNISAKGKNQLCRHAEEKTLEVGLGYQVDKLEYIIDDATWPLPKYREMLYLR